MPPALQLALPEEEDVTKVLNLEKREHGRLFYLWRDKIILVKGKDLLWRTAMGGLTTGSFISEYNIPGAKLECKFCSAPLETAEHLLLGAQASGFSGMRYHPQQGI